MVKKYFESGRITVFRGYEEYGNFLFNLMFIFGMERKFYEELMVEVLCIAIENGFAQSQQEPAPWEDL